MNRIFISGFFGMGNLGDDAILCGILSGFKSFVPRPKFYVVGSSSSHISGSEHVVWLPPNDADSIYDAIGDSHLVVCGGGGLIHDLPYSYYLPDFCRGSLGGMFRELYVTLAGNILQKPVVFCGIGVGPMFTRRARILSSIILNNSDIVTVRDRFSYEELSRIGLMRPVILTADPAFLIQPDEICDENQAKSMLKNLNTHLSKGFVIVTVRPHPFGVLDKDLARMKEQNYIKLLADICDFIVEDIGAFPLFIALQLQGEEDLSVIVRVINEMKNSAVARVVSARVSIGALLELFKMAKFLVGTRLHSLILASLVNCPFIGLSYHPKVRSVAEDLGMEHFVFDLYRTEVAQLKKAIFELVLQYKKIKEDLDTRVNIMRDLAGMNIHLVRDFCYRDSRRWRSTGFRLENNNRAYVTEIGAVISETCDIGEGYFDSTDLLELYSSEVEKLKRLNEKLTDKVTRMESMFLVKANNCIVKFVHCVRNYIRKKIQTS